MMFDWLLPELCREFDKRYSECRIPAFLDVLCRLEAAGLSHRGQWLREDALAIEVAVPGERWEIEFLEDGEIEIEIFRSNGEIHGANTLDDLFRRFGD